MAEAGLVDETEALRTKGIERELRSEGSPPRLGQVALRPGCASGRSRAPEKIIYVEAGFSSYRS